ncbi:MAG: cupin domain-containing protein [Burkholderiaceae bacterium]|nr:cupin domain-containing protein [Burkholderiaceae bacterium]
MSDATASVTKSEAAELVRSSDGEQMNVLGVGVRFLCHATQTGQAWSLMETKVPKDAGPPPHDHPWDEAYYVVDGEVSFGLDDRTLVVGAGDFLYVPAGTLHGFCGASERPARMLIFDAPAHAEGFFRDAEREVREMPRDLAKVPGIGSRHRIRFMPPGAPRPA